MIRKLVLLLVMLFVVIAMNAQDDAKYRRSSIYSIMIRHHNQQFANDITRVFVDMPVPDKYNSHDLSIKIVSVDEKKVALEDKAVNDFLIRNNVASHMVARWFNRDPATGVCNMDLVKSRGLYSASEFDKILASKAVRGNAILEDAGEELIGHTFVLLNDIRYIDRGSGSSVFGGVVRMVGGVATAAKKSEQNNNNNNTNNTNNNQNQNDYEDLAKMTESYKGFKVKIHSYLYRLVWDEDLAAEFYTNVFSENPDENKCKYFEQMRPKFHLELIGEQTSSGSNVSFMGINEDQPLLMVRKACQRALDENVANLQHNFDVFKVKEPLRTTEPITAYIGLKEGMSSSSRYEVLEVNREVNGKTTYKRVGVVAPESDKIWDNRFMASEEKAKGANLGYTTFRKISGGDFYQGMLIREIK